MKRLFKVALAAMLLGGAFGMISTGAAAKSRKAKIFPADKGPNKIDVSEYPEQQQKNYKLVSRRCGKCHTLARVVGSEFVLRKEWRDYVKKMAKKRRSGIRKKDIKPLADFLIYDSKIRKKELRNKKIRALKKAKKEKAQAAAKE